MKYSCSDYPLSDHLAVSWDFEMYIESTDAHDGSSLLINSFNKGSISSLEINKTSSSITDKHFLSDISDPKTSLSLTKSDSDFEYQEKLRKDYDWEVF